MLGGLLYCNPFAPLMVQSPSVYSKRPAPSDENLESSKKKKKRTRSAPKTGAAVNWKQINVLGGDNAPVEARTLFQGGEQDAGMRGSVDADMQESSVAADALQQQASVAAKKPAKKSLSGAEKRKRKQAAAAAPATSERRGAPRMLRWLHSGFAEIWVTIAGTVRPGVKVVAMGTKDSETSPVIEKSILGDSPNFQYRLTPPRLAAGLQYATQFDIRGEERPAGPSAAHNPRTPQAHPPVHRSRRATPTLLRQTPAAHSTRSPSGATRSMGSCVRCPTRTRSRAATRRSSPLATRASRNWSVSSASKPARQRTPKQRLQTRGRLSKQRQAR